MVDKVKGSTGIPEGMEDKPAKKSKRSSSMAGHAGTSTATRANGGTRSSPPRVGGNGSGEAVGEKERSAAAARQNTTGADADTASTSGKTSAGQNTSKRNSR